MSIVPSVLVPGFPIGTSVSAYEADAQPEFVFGKAPVGAPAETSVVDATGAVTFTALDPATDYLAIAQIGGQYRYVNFSTGEPPAASATLVGTAGGVLSGEYPDPAFAQDMATQVELNAHAADTTDVHGIADTAALVITSDGRLANVAHTNADNDFSVSQTFEGSVVGKSNVVAMSADAKQVRMGGIGAAAGIAFGALEDTNLYRELANVLRTDDQFRVGPAGEDRIQIQGGNGAAGVSLVTSGGSTAFGLYPDGSLNWGGDTSLARGAAALLSTPGSVRAAAFLVGSNSGTVDSSVASGVLVVPTSNDLNAFTIKAPNASWGAASAYGSGQALELLREDNTANENLYATNAFAPDRDVIFRIDGHDGGIGTAGGLHVALGLRQHTGFTSTQAAWFENFLDAAGLVLTNHQTASTNSALLISDGATPASDVRIGWNGQAYFKTRSGVQAQIEVYSPAANLNALLAFGRNSLADGTLAAIGVAGNLSVNSQVGDVVLRASGLTGTGVIRLAVGSSTPSITGLRVYEPDAVTNGGYVGIGHGAYAGYALAQSANGNTTLNSVGSLVLAIAGTNLWRFDATGLSMSNNAAGAKISLPADTVAAGGIDFGGDLGIFRAAAGLLRVSRGIGAAGDMAFQISSLAAGNYSVLTVGRGTPATGGQIAVEPTGGGLFSTGTAAGDVVVRNNDATKRLWIGVGAVADELRMDDGKIGFYGVTPVARPAAYTNSSGNTGSRTLPAGFTLNDLSKFVLQILADLQSVGLAQ